MEMNEVLWVCGAILFFVALGAAAGLALREARIFELRAENRRLRREKQKAITQAAWWKDQHAEALRVASEALHIQPALQTTLLDGNIRRQPAGRNQ